MLYFDTIEERYKYIMRVISNDHNLVPSMEDLTNCCSKNLDIKNVMKNLKSQMKYISSGANGHTFYGYNTSDINNPIHYAIKVVAYPKNTYGTTKDIKRPENAELLMIRLLGQLVLEKRTPHLVLPITFFTTSINHFVSINELQNEKRYMQFVQNYKDNAYHDEVSILISEWADRGDFLKYVRKNCEQITLNQWKVLMFQLISCLAIIHERYPAFRHNDLKANNILVQKINDPTSRHKGFHYKIKNKDYYVPSIGIMLKIWDFDFACIPGIVDNAKVEADWTSKVNVTPKRNQYYDLHYFLNTIGRPGFVSQFYEKIPDEFRDFIYRIIPPEYRDFDGKYITAKGRLLLDVEYITPLEILENDIFLSSFRKSYKDENISNVVSVSQAPTIHKENTKKNNQILYSFSSSISSSSDCLE